jgi:hypothetical protein
LPTMALNDPPSRATSGYSPYRLIGGASLILENCTRFSSGISFFLTRSKAPIATPSLRAAAIQSIVRNEFGPPMSLGNMRSNDVCSIDPTGLEPQLTDSPKGWLANRHRLHCTGSYVVARAFEASLLVLHNPLIRLARPTGFEPVTSAFGGK